MEINDLSTDRQSGRPGSHYSYVLKALLSGLDGLHPGLIDRPNINTGIGKKRLERIGPEGGGEFDQFTFLLEAARQLIGDPDDEFLTIGMGSFDAEAVKTVQHHYFPFKIVPEEQAIVFA